MSARHVVPYCDEIDPSVSNECVWFFTHQNCDLPKQPIEEIQRNIECFGARSRGCRTQLLHLGPTKLVLQTTRRLVCASAPPNANQRGSESVCLRTASLAVPRQSCFCGSAMPPPEIGGLLSLRTVPHGCACWQRSRSKTTDLIARHRESLARKYMAQVSRPPSNRSSFLEDIHVNLPGYAL